MNTLKAHEAPLKHSGVADRTVNSRGDQVITGVAAHSGQHDALETRRVRLVMPGLPFALAEATAHLVLNRSLCRELPSVPAPSMWLGERRWGRQSNPPVGI